MTFLLKLAKDNWKSLLGCVLSAVISGAATKLLTKPPEPKVVFTTSDHHDESDHKDVEQTRTEDPKKVTTSTVIKYLPSQCPRVEGTPDAGELAELTQTVVEETGAVVTVSGDHSVHQEGDTKQRALESTPSAAYKHFSFGPSLLFGDTKQILLQGSFQLTDFIGVHAMVIPDLKSLKKSDFAVGPQFRF